MRRPVLRDLQGEHKEAPWVPEYQAPPCQTPNVPYHGQGQSGLLAWSEGSAQPRQAHRALHVVLSPSPGNIMRLQRGPTGRVQGVPPITTGCRRYWASPTLEEV